MMSFSLRHRESRRLRARDKAQQGRSLRVRHSWHPRYRGARILNDEFRRAIERLTGRQRTAWARAGRPGHREREVEKLWVFLAPERAA